MTAERAPKILKAMTASWLVVLALAWAQIALAAHQFDHAAGEIAETCQVCAELERSDDPVLPAKAIEFPSDHVTLPVSDTGIAVLANRRAGAYRTRAPPQL